MRVQRFDRQVVQRASAPVAQRAPQTSAGALAAGLDQVGDTLAAIDEDARNRAGDLEYATARSDFLKARLAAEREIPQGELPYGEWREAYNANLAQSQADLAQTINDPKRRERFMLDTENDIIRGDDRIAGAARRKEADEGRAHLDELVNSNIDTAIGSDDAQARIDLLGQVGAAIDSAEARGYITAQEAQRMRTEADSNYTRRRLEMLPPAARLSALGRGPTSSLGSGIAATIEQYGGADAEILKRFAVLESAGDPGAVNANSGAAGLFQFIPSTARQYNLMNPHDAASATVAARRLLNDNRNGLRSALGREPSEAELYLAHQQGLGGATALLSSPGELAVDVLTRVYKGNRRTAENAVKWNGGNLSMTAGQFAGLWDTKYKGVPAQVSKDGAGLAGKLPPDVEARIVRDAEREIERETIARQKEYTEGFDSYISAVSSGADVGPEIAGRFSDEAISANAPDAETAELMREVRDDALQLADFTRRLEGASPAEIAAMQEELAPGDVADDVDLELAPDRQRAAAAFATAAQRDLEARATDPAGYAARSSDRVNVEDIDSDPASYAAATLLEQERLGLRAEARRLFPSGMAEQYAAGINNMDADTAAQTFADFKAQWGDYANRATAELVRAGLATEYAVALRHTDDPGLAAEIMSLRGVSEADLKSGLESVTVTDMTRELDQSLADYRIAFEAGDMTGQARETFAANFDVARRMALNAMRQGADPTTAVERTVERMFPETVINDPSMRLILPADANENRVTGMLDQAQNAAILRGFNPQPLDDPRLPDFADLEVMLQSAEDMGVWLNNATGDGAILHLNIRGYLLPIQNAEGDYYERKFDQAMVERSRTAMTRPQTMIERAEGSDYLGLQ